MTRNVQFGIKEVAEPQSASGSSQVPWKATSVVASNNSSSNASVSDDIPRVAAARLYVSGIATSVTVKELESLFAPFHPTTVSVSSDISSQTTRGFVEFRTVREAEMAHAILGNLHLKQHTCTVTLSPIELPIGVRAPEPNVGMLMVKYLPRDADNFTLFEMFRSIGPLYLCRVGLSENGENKDFAVVRYYTKADTARAVEELNFGNYKNTTIAIVDFEPKERKPRTGLTPSIAGGSPGAGAGNGGGTGSSIVANGSPAAGLGITSSTPVAAGQHHHRRASSRASIMSPPLISQSQTDDPHQQLLRRVTSPGPYSGHQYTPLPNGGGSSLSSRPTVPMILPPSIATSASMTPSVGGTTTSGVNMRKLFIKNLGPTVSHNDLFLTFKQYGYIHTARVNLDEGSGKSKGTGVITFGNADDATKAMSALNGTDLKGKPLQIVYFDAFAAVSNALTGTPNANGGGSGGGTSTQIRRKPSPSFSMSGAAHQQQEAYSRSQTPLAGLGIDNMSLHDGAVPGDHFTDATSSATAVVPRRRAETLATRETSINNAASMRSPTPSAALESSSVYSRPVSVLGDNANKTFPTDATLSRRFLESLSQIARDEVLSKHLSAMVSVNPAIELDDAIASEVIPVLVKLGLDEVFALLADPIALARKVNEIRGGGGVSGIKDGSVTAAKPTPVPSISINATNSPTSPLVPSAPSPSPATVTPPSVNAAEIDAFVASLAVLSEGQRKQRLGTRLFPLVKATGVKDPTKVTVRILDNVTSLEQLAAALKDVVILKTHVDTAYRSLNPTK